MYLKTVHIFLYKKRSQINKYVLLNKYNTWTISLKDTKCQFEFYSIFNFIRSIIKTVK